MLTARFRHRSASAAPEARAGAVAVSIPTDWICKKTGGLAVRLDDPLAGAGRAGGVGGTARGATIMSGTPLISSLMTCDHHVGTHLVDRVSVSSGSALLTSS